jgi:hypothetical protein
MACLYGGPPFAFIVPTLWKSVIGSFAPQPLHSFSSWVPSMVSVCAPSEPDAPGLGGDGEEGWDMAVSRGAEVAEKAEASLGTLFFCSDLFPTRLTATSVSQAHGRIDFSPA